MPELWPLILRDLETASRAPAQACQPPSGHCPAPPPHTSGRRRLSCQLESPRCVSTSLTPHLISYLLGMSLLSSVSVAPRPARPVHLRTGTVLGGPTGSQSTEVLGGPRIWELAQVGRGGGVARRPQRCCPCLSLCTRASSAQGAGGGQEGPQQSPGWQPTARPGSCRGRWAAPLEGVGIALAVGSPSQPPLPAC